MGQRRSPSLTVFLYQLASGQWALDNARTSTSRYGTLGAPLGKKLLPPDMPATSRPVYYYYFALLSVCSLLIYGVLSRRLFEDLFGRNRFFGPLIPSIALVLLLPFQARKVAHLYDFGVLVLMSALLYAMAAERHRLFLLLFAVSCFNKETTILISIAYAVYFFDTDPVVVF